MLARIFRIGALAGALGLGLAGCFQPLHAPGVFAGGALAPTLASIHVNQIEGHLGYQVKSELDFMLTNGTPPATPAYRLNVTPRGGASSIVVDVQSGRPQIMTYDMSANYVLVAVQTGKVVSAGTVRGFASFDRSTQRYATLRAQRDAEIRAAKQIAEQVRLRIIADFAKPQS